MMLLSVINPGPIENEKRRLEEIQAQITLTPAMPMRHKPQLESFLKAVSIKIASIVN
jgi:hypothetical protein